MDGLTAMNAGTKCVNSYIDAATAEFGDVEDAEIIFELCQLVGVVVHRMMGHRVAGSV